MSSQSHSLLETVLVSSQEVLYAAGEVEEEINQRLLNNANIVKILLEQNRINNSILEKIAKENGINRINIFNRKGKKIYESFSDRTHKPASVGYIKKYLNPIFTGAADTLIIGLKKARVEEAFRYVVAISSKNNDAIVLNLEAKELLEFRRRIGFGVLIKRLTENKDVVFAALEDTSGILAASGNVEFLENMNESDFLINAYLDSVFAWRITEFNNEDVFEAVHPFEIEGTVIGLYRIGLNLEPLNAINLRLTRRIIINGLILFVFGSIILTLIFVRQNFDLLKKQFQSIESYSNKLIQSVSDAIIVVDAEKKIKELNEAAETLFEINSESLIGKEISNLINNKECLKFFTDNSVMERFECEIKNKKKFLLVSKSEFIDENENENFVLVIKDLTEIRDLEKQIARNEQLKAMGELASGVAHEIRNPLNTIGTIVQQLDKDFSPTENKDEYHSLSRLVYKEVRRINETIQNFLRFSKPEPIQKDKFQLSDLMGNIEKQYYSLLKEKSITLGLTQKWDGEVNWDRNQMKQVLMNLIQNAAEAINNSGDIKIEIRNDENLVLLNISDNGIGMPKENLERIFNLYFTTKASGTGIGLSIIQRIVHEHDGIISVESQENVGTTFMIRLPIS